MNASRGIVYLVGAGPGDPGLITVRGLRLLRSADVIVHDRLISHELLLEARRGAEIISVGKSPGRHTVPQDGINGLLVERALAGKLVVRLKGGDPFIFGRGFEEMVACKEAGVDCVVIPGVSSAIAAPAAAGIPLTHRNLIRCFAVLTGKTGEDTGAPDINFPALAAIDAICVMMGRENLREIADGLMSAGRDATTPAACVEWGTTSSQRVVKATLGEIAEAADRAGIEAPIVTVIGAVAKFAETNGSIAPSTGSTAKLRLDRATPDDGRHSAIARPLAGKRVLVTRSRSSSDELARLITSTGATPILCPLIRITYPNFDALGKSPSPLPSPQEGEGASSGVLGSLDRYDWITFTSVHGVIGFFRMLRKMELDARSLARCKVAAVGPATAAALLRRGVRADLTPEHYTAETLAKSIIQLGDSRPRRVLFPRGDQARPVLMQALTANGIAVDDVVVYYTRAVSPPSAIEAVFERGIDVITFYSPSAVQSWVDQKLKVIGAVVACLGPTTADAARAAGIIVDVMATPHTAAGLVDSLARFFAARG